MKQRTRSLIFLQLLNVLFSLASVLVKLASLSMEKTGLTGFRTFAALAGYVLLLSVYAFFWQKVIKDVSISTAYLSKGLVLFWTLLWSVLLFGEPITWQNIVGTAVIVGGTFLVSDNE